MKEFPIPVPQDSKDLLDEFVVLEKEAFDFGFYWTKIGEIFDQIQSETLEVKEAFDAQDFPHLQEEIGDLMCAVLSLSVFCGCDPHDMLRLNLHKFKERFDEVRRLVAQEGRSNLKGQSIEVMLTYWRRAKENCSQKH